MIQIAVDSLRESIPELVAVILFGSFGSIYERSDSDLDLALLTLTPQQDNPVFLWNLAQEIAQKIGRNVDLIDLRKASTVFAFQILTTGTAIYCSNSSVLAAFDTLTLSMYQRLYEERKEILNDYRKGTFHG